jgi:hypothetical protein
VFVTRGGGGEGLQKMYDAKFFGIENLSLKTGEDNAVFISCSTPTCTCQLKRQKQKEVLQKNSDGAKKLTSRQVAKLYTALLLVLSIVGD